MFLERYRFIKYVEHFIGIPYYWGGDDPLQGFDCSGVAVEGLKGVGILPKFGDWAARNLATMFPEVPVPKKGCLVFYGSSIITHVGICIDSKFMIEAGGGGRDTTDIETAIQKNAFIRQRPIKSRSDIVKFVDPFKKL